MFKRLRWFIIISGVLASVARAQTLAPDPVDSYVEKDLFELHAPPENLAQKLYQSADYKVTYLKDITPEEKDLLLASGRILEHREWFLRRMEKNEEPAKQWLKDHKLIDAGKEEPTADQKKRATDAQKARLKNAVSDYNRLVANLVEKRGTPAPGSVAAETESNCTGSSPAALTPQEATVAPAAIAQLSNAYFGIAHRQIVDETKADSDKQVEAAKHDQTYITPSNGFNFSATSDAISANANQHLQHRGTLFLNSSSTSAGNAVNRGVYSGKHASPIGEGIGLANPSDTSENRDQSTPASPVRVARAFNSIVHVLGSPNKLYAISQDGDKINIYTSEDGINWIAASQLTGISKQASSHIRIAVSQNEQDVAITTDTGAYVSSDKGTTFQKIGVADSEAVDVKISDKTGQMLIGFKKIGKYLVGGKEQIGTVNTLQVFDKINGVWTLAPQQPVGLDDYSAAQSETEVVTEHARFSKTGVNLLSVQFDPTHPGALYAGAGNQVFRWDPNQRAWSIMAAGTFHNDSTVYNIDFDEKTNKIFISTCNGVYEGDANSTNPKLSKIGDRSFLWSQGKFGDNAPDDPTAHHALPSASKSLRAYDVTVDPFDHNRILATADTGVYTSKDGGTSWTRMQGGDWQDDTIDKSRSGVRTATWLADGSIVFTGESANATFRATP